MGNYLLFRRKELDFSFIQIHSLSLSAPGWQKEMKDGPLLGEVGSIYSDR